MPLTETRPRLWYERRGDGEPLLFITGFGISCAVFEPVIDLYAASFDVVTYDNRGSGRSDSPLRPTSIPELAGDAARLLDALELESAHVYGVSMGGMVAQELALRFPDRVRGLILGCTSAGGPRQGLPPLTQLGRLADPAPHELLNPGRGWLAAILFSPEFRRNEPERVRRLTELFIRHRPPPHGVSAHWWASVFHDTGSRLPRIASPTLVLHGELDALTPLANSRFLAERIPDAELCVIPGVGHAYALESPQESARKVTAWLSSREPIAAGPPRTDRIASLEPLTRAAGLPIGAVRTGASLAAAATARLRRTRRRP
jgi:pimeloyl-ACP methyl ester carboxylesterase